MMEAERDKYFQICEYIEVRYIIINSFQINNYCINTYKRLFSTKHIGIIRLSPRPILTEHVLVLLSYNQEL